MEQYVGLDVSRNETVICVIDGNGKRVWEGVCSSTPEAIAAVLLRKAPSAVKIGMETGSLAVWHWHELRRAGLPVVCLHARHAKAALSVQLNKTDANDAFGLARRLARSKNVGAHLGLTPRRYQSGEVDHSGRISKCGDRMTRSLLFEAAGVLLCRNKRALVLRSWGLILTRRVGFAKARVAVARKLAVLMHRMWTHEMVFQSNPAT